MFVLHDKACSISHKESNEHDDDDGREGSRSAGNVRNLCESGDVML